jgi:hypothetical protein
MLLFLVVYDELFASVNCIWAWHFHSVDHLFKRKAAAKANTSAAEWACVGNLSTACKTYSMSNLALKIKKVSKLFDNMQEVNDNAIIWIYTQQCNAFLVLSVHITPYRNNL